MLTEAEQRCGVAETQRRLRVVAAQLTNRGRVVQAANSKRVGSEQYQICHAQVPEGGLQRLG